MGARLLPPRIIWATLLFSQAMYVLLMLGGYLQRPSEAPDPIMLYAIGLVAGVVAIVSFVVPRFVHRAGVARSVGDLRHHEASVETIQQRALAIGFTPFILSVALSEAVAIFGLVLFLIGFPFLESVPFSAAGALLTLVRFPTARTFLGPFEEQLGRSLDA